MLVSALTGEGAGGLLDIIENRLAARRQVLDLLLDPSDGAGVSWLHRHTEVMDKTLRDDGQLAVSVRADDATAEQVRGKFADQVVPAGRKVH
jgi:GTP-binding protein HflX